MLKISVGLTEEENSSDPLLNKLHVFEIKFDLTKIHSCIIFIINRFRPCSHGALSVSEHAH